MLNYNRSYLTTTISVSTTDGPMFVLFVDDDDGKCIHVMIQIGKTGSQTRAWTDSLQELINMLLTDGKSIEDAVTVLRDITTDRITVSGEDNVEIKSGPEGLVYAVSRYIKHRDRSLQPAFAMPWSS